MNVTYNGNTFACATAYKGSDYVKLVDSTGAVVASFQGVKDFSAFTLSGGSWTSVPGVDDCTLATVSPDGSIRASSLKVCDILQLYLMSITVSASSVTSNGDGTYAANIEIPDEICAKLDSLGYLIPMVSLPHNNFYATQAGNRLVIIFLTTPTYDSDNCTMLLGAYLKADYVKEAFELVG